MNKYNQLPEHAQEITKFYSKQHDFFNYCFERLETRSCYYDPDNIYRGMFSIKIFWIKEELGLGYGIASDWKKSKIRFYLFGTDEAWSKFKQGFASQFSGDNS